MQNVLIGGILDEVADLLQLKDANPFRVRAYRNAARTVKSSGRPLAAMVAEGEPLTDLPGIGKDISGHIRELVETGELRLLEELRGDLPATLTQLLRLDGLGPKRARALYDELGVESVEDLEAELETGGIEELDGFGARTVEKLKRAVRDYHKHTARLLLAEADVLIAPLLSHLEETPGVERIEPAGSLRRRKDTVGDVDILAVSEQPERLMDRLKEWGAVDRVVGSGRTKTSVVLASGLQVDLRVVPAGCYGAALHYFTGSKEHNVEIRKRGMARGLKVSEYGVFRATAPAGRDEEDRGDGEGARDGEDGEGAKDGEDGRDRENGDGAGERVAGASEEEVFAALDLPWIPPELRENRGEIEAAGRGELPELVTVDDIRGDLQMHSTWSDGKNSILEMAEACRARGYEYLAITDHSQRMSMVGGLDERRAEKQWEELAEVQAALDGIRVFRSMEVDILQDGSLDLDDEHLAALDVVVVSVHSYMNLDREEQTGRIVTALSHPSVDILAHPTGRRLNRREPFEVDMETVLHAALEHDVAVELNAHPQRLDLHDVHVARARELGVPVVVSTDAHSAASLAHMVYGVGQARRGWLEAGDVLNTRSLEEFEEWLGRKRA